MATMTIEPATDARTWPMPELTCLCGQPLELCHTAHCPRCGTTLHH